MSPSAVSDCGQRAVQSWRRRHDEPGVQHDIGGDGADHLSFLVRGTERSMENVLLTLDGGAGDPRRRIAGAVRLPRPMLGSGDLDFSFSGLKTAVSLAAID
mgnify:CR=1 FL=1